MEREAFSSGSVWNIYNSTISARNSPGSVWQSCPVNLPKLSNSPNNLFPGSHHPTSLESEDYSQLNFSAHCSLGRGAPCG